MIKLFSEEVNPTFTSSRHNILTVESYNEVFFDVFEFEINGTTYIAEKLSVYNGKPVVAIPVVEKDVKRTIPFVLTEGSFEVLYNEANNEVVNSAEDQRIIDSIMIEDDVVDIARDYKEDLLEEVEVAKRHAAEYAERVRLQKIAEADITIEEKKQSIREFFDTSKVDLLEEFNTALINNKQDFENYTEQKHSEIEKYLTSRIENNFSEFFDINEERIKELDGRIELSLVDKIKAAEGRVTKDVHETVSQQSDVLTEQIKKGVDKALGRVGNVKTAVNDLQDQLLEKIETVDGSIREYYDTRISNIRDEVDILNESQKDYFINLVEESKTRLLEQVNQNKEETVQALIEENYDPVKGNKDFNKSLKKLKVELEKVISDKFSGELMSLKRAIELHGGGGGTVAKQFANGGVMRGDLTVIGTVSADCGDSNDWCSTYTTVNANSALWNTGGYDFSLLESTSGNWNSTYTTVGTYSANGESTYTTVGSNSADWVTYSSDSISAANWVLDENNLGSNSNTKVPTQQSVKAYVDSIVTGVNNLKGGYDASTDSPPLTAGVGVLQGDTYYIETGGLFYTEQVDPGDLIIAIEDGSNAEGKWVAVNRNLQDELIDKWNSNYTTTSANSANWQSTYTTVDASSGNWDSTYNTVTSLSDTWDDQFDSTAIEAASANWDSTYNTVTSLSDTWDDQFDSTEIEAASGNWNSTYTTVTNESADWESTYTTVDTESANWDSTYSTVGTYSADWESGGAGNFCSTTVLLNEVSACDGTMSIDGILSASDIITTTLSADGVYFNTGAARPPELGELVWDAEENTLDLGLTDGVVLQLGEEQVINVKAAEEIKNGQVVYASGAVGGGSGKIEVSLYSASSAEGVTQGATDELFFVGVATQDIALNGFGYVTTFGKVRDVRVRQGSSVDTTVVGPENTNAAVDDPNWELGTVLYISTSAGRLTNTKPISPNKIIPTAMVIGVEGNQRTLFTRYEHGYHIDELHDVKVVNPSTSDVLVYDSILKTWANITSSNWESTYTTVSSNSANWVKYDIEDIATPATWVLDIDNLTDPEVLGDTDGSATKVPTQQSVKAYVDSIVTGVNNLEGGYDASTDSPPLTAGVGVLQGDTYYVTVAGLFYDIQVDKGDLIIATIDNANVKGEWVVVNRNIDEELFDKWNSTSTTVSANSANWQSTYTTIDAESANWDSTYTTVDAESANWDSTYTTTLANSANWQSTYTTVDAESANWDSTYTTMSSNSAYWDSAAGAFAFNVGAINSIEIGALDSVIETGNNAITIQGDRQAVDRVAQDGFSIALGYNTKAVGAGSIAIGGSATADAPSSPHNAIAIGNSSAATGAQSIAIGQSSNTSGGKSIAIGSFSKSAAQESTSIGLNTEVRGVGSNYSFAIGNKVRVGANGSSAIKGVAEFGSWKATDERRGSIRCSGVLENTYDPTGSLDASIGNTGMVCVTTLSSIDAKLDGGAVVGNEELNQIPRNMHTIRRWGDTFYLDGNDGAGNITTVPLGGGGTVINSVLTVTSNTYTQAAGNTHTLYNDDDAGVTSDITATLMPAADHTGTSVHKKIGSSHNVIITPPVGATIDGQSSFTLQFENESISIFSDGTNFFIT